MYYIYILLTTIHLTYISHSLIAHIHFTICITIQYIFTLLLYTLYPVTHRSGAPAQPAPDQAFQHRRGVQVHGSDQGRGRISDQDWD